MICGRKRIGEIMRDRGTTKASRKDLVEESIHSVELEGGRVTEELRADARDYVDGRINAAGLVALTRARYGAD